MWEIFLWDIKITSSILAFTQQLGINLPLNSLNWPTEEMEDMLRLANVNFQGRNMVPPNVSSSEKKNRFFLSDTGCYLFTTVRPPYQ